MQIKVPTYRSSASQLLIMVAAYSNKLVDQLSILKETSLLLVEMSEVCYYSDQCSSDV